MKSQHLDNCPSRYNTRRCRIIDGDCGLLHCIMRIMAETDQINFTFSSFLYYITWNEMPLSFGGLPVMMQVACRCFDSVNAGSNTLANYTNAPPVVRDTHMCISLSRYLYLLCSEMVALQPHTAAGLRYFNMRHGCDWPETLPLLHRLYEERV